MEEENLKELFDLLKKFSDCHHGLKQKLPYHVNVIDELHINENAHSRILCKLLLFRSETGEYEILQSLIKYISKHNRSFENIRIKSPEITQELERIDIWVRDKDFAIIFENKVYDANDQDAQIARYIQKSREHNYKDYQIYVVYMPSFSVHEPSSQTWNNKETGESLQREFENRYVKVSFDEGILPWLKNDVLPNIRVKDTYLQSAIAQYIDYLEGYFDKRDINKSMNMELKHFLTKELNLNNISNEERLKILEKKTEDITRLLNQMNAFKKSIREDLAIADLEKWKPYIDKIRNDLSSVGKALGLEADCNFFDSTKSSHFYIEFHKNGWDLSIVIEKYGIGNPDEKIGDEVFVYVGKRGEQTVDDKFLNAKKGIFEGKKWKGSPYGWEYIQYNKNLELFMNHIKSGEFANYLEEKVRDILDKIKKNDLLM